MLIWTIAYWLVLVILLFSLVLLAFIYVKDVISPLSKLPGPPFRNPILGDLGPYIRSSFQVIQSQKAYRKMYGTVRRVRMMFGELRVEVADAEWAHYILATNARNYRRGGMRGVEGLRNVVGSTSLLMVDGAYHKQLRKLANPGFKQSLLVQFLATFASTSQRLFSKWDGLIRSSESGCVEISVKDDISELTLDIIGLTAFGYDFNSFVSQGNDLSQTFRDMLNTSKVTPNSLIPGFWKVINVLVLLIPEPLLGPLDGLKLFLVRVAKVHHYMNEFLQKMMKQYSAARSEESSAPSQNLIGFIIREQTSGTLTETELHDMAMTFVLAGHETSSLALTWFLLMMSKHPVCQTRCRAEVRSCLPANAEDISWENLHELKYLSACIQETMRLYPPAPFINRRPIADDVIKGYRIPSGTDVLITVVDIHRNEIYWSEPDQYLPERFLNPDESVPWHAFMPFGDGVHKCIGYQFATAEITLVAALLLRRYSFSVDESYSFVEKAHVTLNPTPLPKLRVRLMDLDT